MPSRVQILCQPALQAWEKVDRPHDPQGDAYDQRHANEPNGQPGRKTGDLVI
jgi:hypothetical protein